MKQFIQLCTVLCTLLPLVLCLNDDNPLCNSEDLDNPCANQLQKIIQPIVNYVGLKNEQIRTKHEKIAQLENELARDHTKTLDELLGKVDSLTRQISSLAPLVDTVGQLKNELKESNEVVRVLQEMIRTDSQKQHEVQKTVDSLSSQMIELKARLGISTENTENIPKSCDDLKDYSGTLQIKPNGSNPFMVSCDSELAGSGWTVIQRRIDGSVNFYRNWTEYREGFGEVEKEYFIGLERLHQMTKGQRYELYIHLVDQSNEVRYARYDNFVVENEDKQYELNSVGKFNGTAGDSLSHHRGQKFSTPDTDNDIYYIGNCAVDYKAAWWFFNCADSNLNAQNFSCSLDNSNALENNGCVYWHHWHGRSYSLKRVQMMIRPWKDQ